MMTPSNPIRVFFNDSHVNLPGSALIPQGGPSRFAHLFTNHFKNAYKDVTLISLLFSHNDKDDRIYLRESKHDRTYFEVVYPNLTLSESYSRQYTKAAYLKFLAPWLSVVGEALDRAQPDIVFLNGFSIANWMILNEASRRSIPVCVQQAGIWKKELQVVKHRFSPSIRRIFSRFEKDIIEKAACQIFLNEFSRDAFFKIHRTVLTPKRRARTTIVPLPIVDMPVREMHMDKKPTHNVAIIARWDAIKNHAAMKRLAAHAQKVRAPFSMFAVTKWAETPVTELKRQYPSLVGVVPPMSPEALYKFYASVDAIIIPSRFDVSPTVLMEAILSGKPVIISHAVGWVSDYKHLGFTDLIVRPAASGKILTETLTQLFRGRRIYLPRFRRLQAKILREHAPNKVFATYHKILKNFATPYARQK